MQKLHTVDAVRRQRLSDRPHSEQIADNRHRAGAGDHHQGQPHRAVVRALELNLAGTTEPVLRERLMAAILAIKAVR